MKSAIPFIFLIFSLGVQAQEDVCERMPEALQLGLDLAERCMLLVLHNQNYEADFIAEACDKIQATRYTNTTYNDMYETFLSVDQLSAEDTQVSINPWACDHETNGLIYAIGIRIKVASNFYLNYKFTGQLLSSDIYHRLQDLTDDSN